MTNFTINKSKQISQISKVEHVFPFSHSVSQSQAFQVYFIGEYSQIPNLAAGHLQAL